MRKWKNYLWSSVLLGFILLTNTACPVVISPSRTGSWADVDFAYELLYKGLMMNWYCPLDVPWPSRVRWGLPNNVEFFGFQANQPAGVLGIDGDFDRRLATSGKDYSFYFRGLSSMRAFVDFNANGTLDSSDASVDYSSSTRQFELNYPGSNFLAAGGYSVNILPTSFQIKTGVDNAIGDVPLDIVTATGTTHRNLAFLNNTQILPQFAYGDLGGGRNLTSQIVANNPTGVPLSGVVSFFNHDGGSLPVELGGNTSNVHAWTVPAGASRIWEPLNPVAPLKVGWGIAYGGVEYAVNYGIYSGRQMPKNMGAGNGAPQWVVGDLAIEAGISASDVSLKHVMNVTKASGGIDTAFSIVNPTSAAAIMLLILSDASGERARKDLTLGPKNGIARFFGEFFGVNFDSFSGTLLIQSDTSVATTSLKTLNGEPSASLPAGTFRIR
ncbi:MAG: hypothetical protein HY644_12620 [Acidobacteria bacterium]|nr:hypothetical protein [Acidobacteriota bacterium]